MTDRTRNMTLMTRLACACAIAVTLLPVGRLQAAVVRVEIHGAVEINRFFDGPVANGIVSPGDPVILKFDVDPAALHLSPNYYTPPPNNCQSGGYDMIPGSFLFRMGAVDIPLDVSSLSTTPYLGIAYGDPGAAVLFFSVDPTYCDEIDVPVVIAASGAPFGVGFFRYVDDGLTPMRQFSSQDLLASTGYLGFEWVTEFNYTIDGSGTPMFLDYDTISLTQLSPPSLSQGPSPANSCNAGHASFSVVASQADSYQWRLSGTPLSDGAGIGGAVISGSNTATLTISNLNASYQGSYDCLVSNGPLMSLPYDVVGSNPAQLTVWASCVSGDMNCDLTVSPLDIDGFVQELLNAGSFVACNPNNGDMNHDGRADGLDIQLFTNCIMGNCP